MSNPNENCLAPGSDGSAPRQLWGRPVIHVGRSRIDANTCTSPAPPWPNNVSTETLRIVACPPASATEMLVALEAALNTDVHCASSAAHDGFASKTPLLGLARREACKRCGAHHAARS